MKMICNIVGSRNSADEEELLQPGDKYWDGTATDARRKSYQLIKKTCPRDQGVCGINTSFDHKVKNDWNDSAINEVEILCCPVGTYYPRYPGGLPVAAPTTTNGPKRMMDYHRGPRKSMGYHQGPKRWWYYPYPYYPF